MDKKEMRKFKTLLQSRAEELRRSVAETQQEGRIAQEVHGRDEGDRASRSHEKELLFHRNTQVRNLLKAIESALDRIEDGTFGECINCGQEINTKRLEALPWTWYCITCQQLLEQQH
jgi:DnaK suppressor protein